MAASVRLRSSRALDHRLLFFNTPARSLPLLRPLTLALHLQNPNLRIRNVASSAWDLSAAVSSSDPGDRRPSPLTPYANQLFLSITSSDLSKDHVDRSLSEPGKGDYLCDSVGELAANGGCCEKGALWTVVLLGWLGAEEKHLKRYANIYHARGILSVRIVVPLWELVGSNLGRKMEDKHAKIAEELTEWCSESEKDGRKRHLLFHTFSNAGWLSYGSILKNLQSRKDVLGMIKGCVIDSGPSPEISPKVWAAGFCAAMIKKRSSAVYSFPVPIDRDNADADSDRSNKKDLKPNLLEVIAMFILEKVFSLILIIPVVNQSLTAIISTLTKNQPPCPQLYLYSSADRVIPASSVESFIQEQKAMGRIVRSYDFGTSPHVDHFRNFPHIYSAKIAEFVEECCSDRNYECQTCSCC